MAHILVVDDDRATVHLLTILLEMDGYKVSGLPKPHMVVDRARANAVDAFIIDCHLPGYSGLDLVREIRADEKLMTKLVVMTSGRDMAEEAVEAGADLFLLKPFSPTALSSQMAELLREQERADS